MVCVFFILFLFKVCGRDGFVCFFEFFLDLELSFSYFVRFFLRFGSVSFRVVC